MDDAVGKHSWHLLLAVVSAILIHLNFVLLCHYPQRRRIRYLYLVLSGPLALALVQRAVLAFNKALSVQISGAYFATYLKAIEYCAVEDPSPVPRVYSGYLLATLREVFIPFEGSGAAVRAAGKHPQEPQANAAGGSKVGRQYRHLHLQRPPLASPGSSYFAAAVWLISESVLQYLLYDSLMTLCVKPLTATTTTTAAAAAVAVPITSAQPGYARPLSAVDTIAQPLPLLSARSLLASVAFTACLYVHFALSFRAVVLALSLKHPRLLHTCRHQFQQPWRGLASVTELWQRWHQMFRVTFVRLAYRPARALAARMLHRQYEKAARIGASTAAAGRYGHADGIIAGGLRQTAAAPGDNKGANAPGGGADSLRADGGRGWLVHGSRTAPLLNGNSTAPLLNGLDGSSSNGAGRARSGDDMVVEAVGVMAVFFLSGVIHEYMCWAAFGRAQGWQLLFFWAHGLAVLLEGAGRAYRQPSGRLARGAKTAATAMFCVLSSVVFMRPWLLAGYQRDFWHPVSPVRWLLARAGSRRMGVVHRPGMA